MEKRHGLQIDLVFEPEEMPAPPEIVTGKGKSFGLLGMKERVFLIGGKFALRSEPGKGTSLAISAPVP